MNLQPMPRDWHQRASWRAKQHRRDALKRYIADLAHQRVEIVPTIAPDPNGHAHALALAAALGGVCTEPGCNRPHSARGLCVPHYKRAYRAEGVAA